MNIFRFAELYALKYADISSSKEEEQIRKDIHILWEIPNKHFNILSACAQSEPRNPKNNNEVKAVSGFKFCQELLSTIDYLKSNFDKVSLGEMKEALLSTVNLIKSNEYVKYDLNGKKSEKGEASNVQFPHVSELIFEMIPIRKQNDRIIRDQQFAKAKKGLSRILSFSLSILEKLSKLEMKIPEKFEHAPHDPNINEDQKLPERFSPQRGTLSDYDIIDFIRQHGDEYGINTTEDWGIVFRDDPKFKEEMTTVINALNRGHYPRGSVDVKMQIAEILKRHEERKENNSSYLLNQDIKEGISNLKKGKFNLKEGKFNLKNYLHVRGY